MSGKPWFLSWIVERSREQTGESHDHVFRVQWMQGVSSKIVGTLLGHALRDLSRFRRGRKGRIVVLALPALSPALLGIGYWIKDYSKSVPVRVCTFLIFLNLSSSS